MHTHIYIWNRIYFEGKASSKGLTTRVDGPTLIRSVRPCALAREWKRERAWEKEKQREREGEENARERQNKTRQTERRGDEGEGRRRERVRARERESACARAREREIERKRERALSKRLSRCVDGRMLMTSCLWPVNLSCNAYHRSIPCARSHVAHAEVM